MSHDNHWSTSWLPANYCGYPDYIVSWDWYGELTSRSYGFSKSTYYSEPDKTFYITNWKMYYAGDTTMIRWIDYLEYLRNHLYYILDKNIFDK